MKYISRGIDGTFELAAYENYLKRDRDSLTASLHGAELLNIDRFVPIGPGSFHDSRFQKFIFGIADPAKPNDENAVLLLKGPYFDRLFELHYMNVDSCSFSGPRPEDDLLMHELRKDNGLLIHEIHFDNGRVITISCRELRFFEIVASDSSNQEHS